MTNRLSLAGSILSPSRIDTGGRLSIHLTYLRFGVAEMTPLSSGFESKATISRDTGTLMPDRISGLGNRNSRDIRSPSPSRITTGGRNSSSHLPSSMFGSETPGLGRQNGGSFSLLGSEKPGLAIDRQNGGEGEASGGDKASEASPAGFTGHAIVRQYGGSFSLLRSEKSGLAIDRQNGGKSEASGGDKGSEAAPSGYTGKTAMAPSPLTLGNPGGPVSENSVGLIHESLGPHSSGINKRAIPFNKIETSNKSRPFKSIGSTQILRPKRIAGQGLIGGPSFLVPYFLIRNFGNAGKGSKGRRFLNKLAQILSKLSKAPSVKPSSLGFANSNSRIQSSTPSSSQTKLSPFPAPISSSEEDPSEYIPEADLSHHLSSINEGKEVESGEEADSPPKKIRTVDPKGKGIMDMTSDRSIV